MSDNTYHAPLLASMCISVPLLSSDLSTSSTEPHSYQLLPLCALLVVLGAAIAQGGGAEKTAARV